MKQFMLALVAVFLLGVGCEKKPTEPVASPAGQNVQKSGTNVPPTAAVGADDMLRDAAGKVIVSAPGDPSTQLDQVSSFIDENRLTAADEVLTRIEGNKPNLPQPLQDRIAKLRQRLNVAKAAGTDGAGAQTGVATRPVIPR